MKKIFLALAFAFLLVSAFWVSSYAADFCGMYDNAGMLNDAQIKNINGILKEIYDKYGVSAYLHIVPADSGDLRAFVEKFWTEKVGPHSDIKYGVIMVWDGNNYNATPFHNTGDDTLGKTVYTQDYLAQAVTASFKGASSAAEVYLNFAAAIRERAKEFYGSDSASAPKPDAEASQITPERQAEINAATAGFYELDGDKVPGVYGALGERRLLSVQTGSEGGSAYLAATYATDDVVEDIQKYAAALNTEGWVLTKQEGTWEKGSFTVGKQSKDAGKILLLTVEMKGASFQVNTAKMEGTLNIDK